MILAGITGRRLDDSSLVSEVLEALGALRLRVIPLIVIYEYIWFLKGMEVNPSTALDKLEDYILSEEGRVYMEDDRLVRKALTSLSLERISLSWFNDEINIEIAVKEEVPLATFDRRMRIQAKKLGVKQFLDGRRFTNHSVMMLGSRSLMARPILPDRSHFLTKELFISISFSS